MMTWEKVPVNTNEYGFNSHYEIDNTSTPLPDLPSISALTSGVLTLYIMNSETLRLVMEWFWSTSLLDSIRYDPLGLICGVYISPITPTVYNQKLFRIGGKHNTDDPIYSDYTLSQYEKIDMGEIKLVEYYGSFIDYDNKIILFLPYLGFNTISISDFMNKSIKLTAYVDWLTGDILYIVSSKSGSREFICESYNGNIYSEIPITSARSTALQSNNLSSMINGAGVPFKSPVGSVASLASSAIINASTSTTEYNRSGKISGNMGLLNYQKAFIMIERKVPSISQGLVNDIGFRSDLSEALKRFKGYTKVRAINLSSIPCTASERDELMELLTSGVYL